ncbi:glycosyltransferase [Brachybacterium halotolerans subsp. kimchii]|uniref:glycosyltransferase family 2 protein n=1 Tax=Brachybacterium halotolerans TaxID=2795215 RepID=UPI001E3F76B1|nr:glycosyltransferase [Brachybacterium halotolerans]UEJ81129.1 glycosyltransferase [Brachybacterium halotolerans subsp. kimchii]
MSAPAASLIVPTHRGAGRLPALLEALAAQAPGTGDFEVVVVVDGDEDGSTELLQRTAESSALALRAIVLPENRGRVAALNTGFEAARGEVLVRCDDDLLPGPRFVARHLAAHADGVERGVVGLYRNRFEPTPYASVYGEGADERFRADAYAAPADLRWRYWAGNCSLPRSLWERVGSYDPAYRLYGWEDVDYGYRIAQAGAAVVLDPALETAHRAASVTTRIRARRAAQAAAARRIFEAKHGTGALPPAIPPWSLWNAAVRAASLGTGVLGPRRTGGAVDRMLPLVPRGAGRRLVGLAVEGAALAGYRHPERAKEVF